jgi:hypothetical protein
MEEEAVGREIAGHGAGTGDGAPREERKIEGVNKENRARARRGGGGAERRRGAEIARTEGIGSDAVRGPHNCVF